MSLEDAPNKRCFRFSVGKAVGLMRFRQLVFQLSVPFGCFRMRPEAITKRED